MPLDRPAPRASSAQSLPAISAFFVLTFAWSWGLVFCARYAGERLPLLGELLAVASGFGPSLAALAVVAVYGGGAGLRNWLEQRLTWRRIRWRWYAVAFGLPPATMMIALALERALGGTLAASPAGGHLALAVANFGLVLLVGGPLGEELGWRGYALPAIGFRLSWRPASLLIGGIWGLWHLPMFFIPGMPQAHVPFPLFLVSAISESAILGWLFLNTKQSIVPAMVMHTSTNAWLNILPVLPTTSSVRPLVLTVGIQALVALLLLFNRGTTVPRRNGE